MENQGQLILDISSDEETGFADAREGGSCEFADREEVDWLSNLLVEVGGNIDDDSDDVVFVSEVLVKPPKKSRSESLKPLAKVVVDDDDCVVLDGDPDKSIVVVNNKVDDDDDGSDDLEIVGEKGEVACRDFPHPRHDCAKHPFASTPHDLHCSQCHCYVCDSLAPCPHWGTGIRINDHCHASDKDEFWKAERKQAKKGDKSNVHSTGGTRLESFFQPIQLPGCSLAQPNSLPQNQAFNPATIRPCSVSSNVSLPNAINSVRCLPTGYVTPRYNPQSQLVSVQSHPRSTNIVAPKVAFSNKSYHIGSQNPQPFPPRTVFKWHGLPGASTNNRHAYRLQLPQNRRPSVFQTPVTNGHHGSNQQIVGSQAGVSGMPLPNLSSPRNMDAGRARYLPSQPQINSQLCSSYQNPGLIPLQSQTSSKPFVNGNSLSSPYIYPQPTVGHIKNSAAPEPYSAYIPSSPLPSETVTSYQSDAGNTFSNQLLSGCTVSSHSSLGNDFDSGSSQLQEHSGPNSSSNCGQNDVQQCRHTQSGMDESPTDYSLLSVSSVNHSKMQVHAEQSQYPSPAAAAAAETSQIQDTVDILPRLSVEIAAADVDCQLPESRDTGSLDFNFFDGWTFENQSFSGALEAPTSPNWNIYSPEPAFTGTGTLFDI